MVPPSHFPLLAEEKSLCAGVGVFSIWRVLGNAGFFTDFPVAALI